MSSTPPSTANNRRSTRIEEKKRKLENPTSDNSSEINDNNSTTKQKKSKTNKNGNGNGQVDHDGKLDDDTIPPYNKTVRNELQEMPHNTIYWLCFTNQLSYYILNNAGSYGQEEELQHIPNLVNTLVSYYSQQTDCFALLINDINTIHEYDNDKYYSIKGFDESMPASYYVTHADLAKSLDKATVHDDDDDDDEQSTTSTSNASTKIGKDDEQNREVESINGGISMEVELSTNNDIPPKTTFKSLDNCEEKNVRPSPTSAIDDLSPFTNESEKSNNKSITILQQSTTSLSKLDSGKSSLLQSSPASAFRTVPQQHTLPPLKSPLLQSPPVSTFREQSTRPTLNDNDVPNSHTTQVDEDARDKSNLKSDHIDTQLVDESLTAALQLDTTLSPIVIPDSWGQSHELGPILSSIFTTFQQEYKSSSFRVIWNGMKEKYRKLTYAKSAKPNDPFLIQQKELDDATSKLIYLTDITHTQMRKEGKGPLSYAEEELWSLLSILGLLHLKEVHPIITKDCVDGQFQLRKLTELKGELRGQYRLLKDLDDIVNGRRKIGISNRKVEGMLRRIWEQLYPSSTDGSVEHEVEEEDEEEEEGTTGKISWELFLLASSTF